MVDWCPSPQALTEAAREFGDRDSGRWCSLLKNYGIGAQRIWGFRIYRTVYTPESDRDFATGLEILSAHMREECFYDAMGHTEEPLDDFPNRELWSRMKLDIIDDPSTFDGASPTAIQQHFQSWIESQGFHLPNAQTPNPSLKMAGSASHRFCIIIDAEALQNLLRFPLQPPPLFDLDDHIGVKVLDVECNADSTEYPAPFDAGWLWAAPRDLALIWFDCPTLAPDVMRDVDGAGRPVVDIEL